MQLFYHGTRDIELPAASRAGPAPLASRRCEACGRALTDQEASQTGAQGLRFCAECRGRLDRSAIQIHFCDACGVSVPLVAVQEGSALTPDGRILCAACRAPRPRASPRVPWQFVALAAGALGLGALLAWLLRA
jgi:hypothetical protein